MKDSGNRIIKTTVSLLLAVSLAVSGEFGIAAEAGDVLPAKYDLRDDGLVTPVKFQNPWGTCLSFGGIAAMETSLLSYMGETKESYKASHNGKDFDLSEKHLAWFALQPVTEDICSSQKGEGVYPISDSEGQESHYNFGGELILIGTLLSSGIGPLTEEEFPYMGKKGLTKKDYYRDNPEEAEKAFEEERGYTIEEYYETEKKNGTLAQLIENYKEQGLITGSVTAKDFTVDDLKKAIVAKAMRNNCYSSHDDWTIDEKNEDGRSNRNLTAGFVLKDANTLPEFSVRDENKHWIGINEEGMRAIKQELLEGKGVIAGYCADHSLPGQSVNKAYINTDTWAHYTYNDEESGHCICIVGWDDTYSRKNFNSGHRPPGDGAWIVKNSWGSETEYKVTPNGEKIGYVPWGVTDDDGKHTGYFYLSYYDKTIEQPETISFTANIMATGGEMYALAYDYMPSTGLPLVVQSSREIKTAAVFTNEEGKDLDLVSFSTKTAKPNAQVVYEVYKLKDGSGSPEDGEYLGRRRAFYPYAGFHREDMMKGITIKDGETFSIVAKETVVTDDGKRVYEYAINNAKNKNGAISEDDSAYSVGIVNGGENYLYTDGEWFDWADVMEEEMSDAIDADKSPDNYAIDNFSIKAFLVDNGK